MLEQHSKQNEYICIAIRQYITTATKLLALTGTLSDTLSTLAIFCEHCGNCYAEVAAVVATATNKGQIPLRYLVAYRSEAGRRPAAS